MFFSSILSEDYSRGGQGSSRKAEGKWHFYCTLFPHFSSVFRRCTFLKKRGEKCNLLSFNNTEETPEIYMTGWKRPRDFHNFDVFHYFCARDSRHSALYRSHPKIPAATALLFSKSVLVPQPERSVYSQTLQFAMKNVNFLQKTRFSSYFIS